MQLTTLQRVRLRLKILHIYAKKIFSVRSVERILRDIILGSDTTTIRILLANASLVWAIMLMTQPQMLYYPMFDIMRVIGGSQLWAAAFFFHFIGVYWRAYDTHPKQNSCVLINAYGFFLWFFTTVATNYYAGFMNPGTALELVICGASAWALYKTGSLTDRRNLV